MLKRFISDYINAQKSSHIVFAWQGGEPTLMGIDFFREAVALQLELAPPGIEVSNALQTNGTLLDDQWGEFLAEQNFLVGVSCDGPPELHDRYRVDRGGQPTAQRVLRGIEFLRHHRVEFNILCTVNAINADHPERVYRFLRNLGTAHLQFIPIVERRPSTNNSPFNLAAPYQHDTSQSVTPWSVSAQQFGHFMTTVFDLWRSGDCGRIFIRDIEHLLSHQAGEGVGLCVYARECGRCIAVEHDGAIYACDHYVYPDYRLGSLNDGQRLADIVDSADQRQFGAAKHRELASVCRSCPHLDVCWGGCPKHRFVPQDDSGHPGNYLCASYAQFFSHARPHLQRLQHGHSIDPLTAITTPAPTDTMQECPCGSGRPMTDCHG